MATAPVRALLSSPKGIRMAVTLAGQGVIKMTPISSSERPVFSLARALAIFPAISTGALMGKTWSIRPGKRTRINRVTAGQAELITGFSNRSMEALVAAETSSAAFETSKTSSNPNFSNPERRISTSSKLRNWP